MENSKYDALELKNQLCFPVYALSREIVKKYRPYLDPLDLTYTQYIAMIVLWEVERINVKDLGERLYLDSGTLTPVLKSLESKGFITRKRNSSDERVLDVSLTEKGIALKDRAAHIPGELTKYVNFNHEEMRALYNAVYKLLERLKEIT